MPLTGIGIRRIKPSQQPQKISDGEGLHLFVAVPGSKLWRMSYRYMENSVRRAYARGEHWDERVRMMAWWADQLDALRASGN